MKALIYAKANIEAENGYVCITGCMLAQMLRLMPAAALGSVLEYRRLVHRSLETPLHCAVLNGHAEAVHVLLGWNKAGSKAESRSQARVGAKDVYNTLAHYVTVKAARCGSSCAAQQSTHTFVSGG
jgi:hypothetical protein